MTLPCLERKCSGFTVTVRFRVCGNRSRPKHVGYTVYCTYDLIILQPVFENQDHCLESRGLGCSAQSFPSKFWFCRPSFFRVSVFFCQVQSLIKTIYQHVRCLHLRRIVVDSRKTNFRVEGVALSPTW